MVKILTIVSGEQLRRLRVINKLSQSDIAELLNVTRGTIARWESLDDITNLISLKQIQTLTELFEETSNEL